jgi:DNA-binding response OmpR family regulator
VRLDTAARSVTAQGLPVTLTNKEFAILEYLIHHSGRLLSRQQLEEHVWDYDYPGESNLVEVYIARIRRKLGEAGVRDAITTVRGAGYRFEAD